MRSRMRNGRKALLEIEGTGHLCPVAPVLLVLRESYTITDNTPSTRGHAKTVA